MATAIEMASIRRVRLGMPAVPQSGAVAINPRMRARGKTKATIHASIDPEFEGKGELDAALGVVPQPPGAALPAQAHKGEDPVPGETMAPHGKGLSVMPQHIALQLPHDGEEHGGNPPPDCGVSVPEQIDPVDIAKAYNEQGADELVFLDITASAHERGIMAEVVAKTAEQVFIPLTVGGGIRTIEDFRRILKSGADKISVNSAALKNPQLISEAASKFGSQCVVCAIDAKKRADGSGWEVYLNGGRVNTGKDALEWAIEAEKFGAGEILLTSMDTDGTKDGYDLSITKAVAEAVKIPVIASGGAGALPHFADVIKKAGASAVLAASLFHYNELTIRQVKEYLCRENIPVRI